MRIRPTAPCRLCLLLLFAVICGWALPAFSANTYIVDAGLTSMDGMMFPIGRLLPTGGLNNSSDVDFNALKPIFWMQIRGNTGDQTKIKIFVRMELITGTERFSLFTVSSEATLVGPLIQQGPMDNVQLANHPNLHMGNKGEVQPRRVLSVVDGQYLREGLYAVTIALVDTTTQISDWPEGGQPNGLMGIKTVTMKIRNPSQVTLIQPDNRAIIDANPIFAWSFPRTSGVKFHFQLVSGEPGANPSTAIDFASDANRFCDTTIVLPAGSTGEQTSFTYFGSGNQRRLERNLSYFWRVTAFVPVLMGGSDVQISSLDYTFSYGEAIRDIITVTEPYDGEIVQNIPNIRWKFPILPELEYTIDVYKDAYGNGEKFGSIQIVPDKTESANEQIRRYGTGINEKPLVAGNYYFRIVANYNLAGEHRVAESDIIRFVYSPRPVQVTLISPASDERLDNPVPTFKWKFPPTIPVAKWYVWLVENEDTLFTKEVEGFLREYQCPMQLPPAAKYTWSVVGLLGPDSSVASSWGKFSFPLPVVEIKYPDNNEKVYTQTPLFAWTFPEMPAGNKLTFNFKIYTDAQGEILNKTIGVGRSYKYPGVPELMPDVKYRWKVTASFELEKNKYEIPSKEYIFYFTPSNSLDSAKIAGSLKITEPEDEVVVDKAPTFRWSFLELPDDLNPTFEVNVTPANDPSQSQKLPAKGAAHEVAHVAQNRVGSMALVDTTVYNYDVTAQVTNPNGGNRFSVTTKPQSFTYKAPTAEPPVNKEIQQLLAAFYASMPPELAAALDSMLKVPGGKISGIKLDGREISIQELMDQISQGKLQIVSVSPPK